MGGLDTTLEVHAMKRLGNGRDVCRGKTTAFWENWYILLYFKSQVVPVVTFERLSQPLRVDSGFAVVIRCTTWPQIFSGTDCMAFHGATWELQG